MQLQHHHRHHGGLLPLAELLQQRRRVVLVVVAFTVDDERMSRIVWIWSNCGTERPITVACCCPSRLGMRFLPCEPLMPKLPPSRIIAATAAALSPSNQKLQHPHWHCNCVCNGGEMPFRAFTNHRQHHHQQPY